MKSGGGKMAARDDGRKAIGRRELLLLLTAAMHPTMDDEQHCWQSEG
jgi:hypothetical protein